MESVPPIKSVPEMDIDFLNKSSYIIYKWNMFHWLMMNWIFHALILGFAENATLRGSEGPTVQDSMVFFPKIDLMGEKQWSDL